MATRFPRGLGCADPMTTEEQAQQISNQVVTLASGWLGEGVYRLEDPVADIACWIAKGYQTIAISCLPIEQTDLDR
jgi:hypothetical protein